MTPTDTKNSRIRYRPTASAPLIVATDGRPQSDAAIRAGALLADTSNAWSVLTVVSPFAIVAPELDLQLTAQAAVVHREAQVQSVHEQIGRILGEQSVRVAALDGNPAGVIADVAKAADASLIVAGLGRHNVLDRVLGDETVLRLVRSASTPVLAIGSEFVIPRTVVVGVDFSENSVHAAELALRFVDHDSTVYLMHVVSGELLGVIAGGPAAYHEHAMAAMTELVTRLEVPPRVHVEPIVRQGDPGALILEHGAHTHADMIAIGTRGLGFVARMLSGSVASQIIRRSPIAVLTLPE